MLKPQSERKTIEQIRQAYNEHLENCTKYLFYTRSTEKQKEIVANLMTFKEEIKRYKYGAIKARNEQAANILFHFQCILNSNISLLELWINLKSNKYNEAWDSLIEAEKYLEYGIKCVDGHYGLEEYGKKLIEIEHSIFPGFPYYNSMGIIIKGGKCSICGQPFTKCKHIEEKIYWGRVCRIIEPEKIDIDHSAIVKIPKDRRCIITEISDEEGSMINYFTWDRSKKLPEDKRGERIISGVLFYNKELDID